MRKNVDHVLLAVLAIVCVLGALGWGTEWEFRRQVARRIGLNAAELERRAGGGGFFRWHERDHDYVTWTPPGVRTCSVRYDLGRSKTAASFRTLGYDCKMALVGELQPPVDWLRGIAMWESTDPTLVSQWIHGFGRHDSHDDSITTAGSFGRKRSRGVGH